MVWFTGRIFCPVPEFSISSDYFSHHMLYLLIFWLTYCRHCLSLISISQEKLWLANCTLLQYLEAISCWWRVQRKHERMALWVRLLCRTQKICFNLWFCHTILMRPLENCVGSEYKLSKHDNDNSSTLYLPCYCITTFSENAIAFTALARWLEQWSVGSFGSTATQK